MTAKKTQSEAPFGPSAIARYWGDHGLACSRQYADKCIRALGCPTDSLEAALAWRTVRTVAGSRSAGGASGAPEENSPIKKIPIMAPAEILGDGLDATLARARQTERVQYSVWLAAITSGDIAAQTVALRNHKDAQKNLVEIESMVIAGKEARGHLVDLVAAQNLIASRLSGLQAARPTLSRILALTFFPDAPHRYQPRIEEELGRLLDPALASAARPLVKLDLTVTPAPSPISAVVGASLPAEPPAATAA